MSDTDNMTADVTDTSTDDAPHGAETDWKAAARKWEARAKANKEAAEELERLKAANMSETEKLVKRAEDAEALVKQFQAQQQHDEDAHEISEKTGVPFTLLSYCSDREAMERFAAEYGPASHVSAAPKAPATRIVGSSANPDKKASSRDQFAEFMAEKFNR